MDYYIFKTRPNFLPLVRAGIKKHEYRLATPSRRHVQVGDILVLVNNDDKFDFVKVVVKGVEFFDTWEEPIERYGLADFKTMFKTIDEIKQECGHFYSRDNVRQYGIEVLEMELFCSELKNSNVLLDTNIVIHRESSNNIANDVIQLYKSLDNLKAKKYVIEDIKTEIKKHRNTNVVDNMLAKIEAYNCLPSRDIDDGNFLEVVSRFSNDDNSKIDNKFLYQIYKGFVDFFVTDDKGILEKARQLYIDDVVLSATDFLNLVEKKYPSFIDYNVLSVELCNISELNLNDKFFESLREDYGKFGFSNWIAKKYKSGEKAYIFKNREGLQGFLYLKIENEEEDYSDIEPRFEPKRRLKIGTFKINSTGLRVGERFLKIIFDYAQKSSVDEIYVTLFENKREEIDALKDLMMQWGFEKFGRKLSTNELVMVKIMNSYIQDKDPKYNYPNLKSDISYGVLPIDYQFHTDLFPDLYLKNENMTLFEEKPCSYAVEKIYVCSTKRIPLKPGDLMAIYRMSEKLFKMRSSVVSGICVLQQVIYASSFDKYLEICNNRTVFEQKQLKEFYYEKHYTTILKVLFLKPLKNKIILSDLINHGIINEENGPRLTTTISENKFVELLEMGGIK